MLHKTRGIVFKVTDYSESSVVAKIFTEKFGLQAYLINGVKKSRAKIRLNMLQPLHLLDMVVYHKPNGNIQRIAELRNQPLLQQIPYDIVKSSLAIFINEALYRSVKQHFEDRPLFEFIFSSIELLDKTEAGLANFHMVFLLQLSRYLGFYPERSQEDEMPYFDLKNGMYTGSFPVHSFVLREEETKLFKAVLKTKFETLQSLHMSSSDRKQLLEKIIVFYKLHLDDFGEMRSASILEEILS